MSDAMLTQSTTAIRARESCGVTTTALLWPRSLAANVRATRAMDASTSAVEATEIGCDCMLRASARDVTPAYLCDRTPSVSMEHCQSRHSEGERTSWCGTRSCMVLTRTGRPWPLRASTFRPLTEQSPSNCGATPNSYHVMRRTRHARVTTGLTSQWDRHRSCQLVLATRSPSSW